MPSKTVGVDSLTTFAFAIFAPPVADLFLDLDGTRSKFSKLSRAGIILGCLASASLSVVSLVREHQTGDISAAIISVILSLVLWYFIAINSERFLPDSVPAGSIGGVKPSAEALHGGGLPK